MDNIDHAPSASILYHGICTLIFQHPTDMKLRWVAGEIISKVGNFMKYRTFLPKYTQLSH